MSTGPVVTEAAGRESTFRSQAEHDTLSTMIKTLRIQHVSIPRPRGSDRETRSFYGEVLGLEELPVPDSILHLDLIWFRVGDQELHVFAEDPIEDPSGRHLCLQVEDLEKVRGRLLEAGHQPEQTIPIPGRPRFFCRDPFGNRIEFTQFVDERR